MGRNTLTMSDVARLAGVSKMTVSNVINDRTGVSGPVRERVLEVIRQSGYRVNVTARTLKSGRTGVIGLAVPQVDSSYFGRLAALVIEQARARGFHVALEQTGAGEAGELDAIAQSHKLQFDGLVLSAVGLDPGDPRLSRRGLPIVMLGERDFGAEFDHVAMPNEDGARAATAHLGSRGCRRIAMVTGADVGGVDVAGRRHRGYLAGLSDLGLEADPSLLVRCPALTSADGRAAAHRLVDAGVDVDAVVAVTDTVAVGLLRGFADRGVAVPGQVRVVGFDDIPDAEFTVPSLSTVAPDHAWMAAKAVELVTARIEDASRPVSEYVAPFVIAARESSR